MTWEVFSISEQRLQLQLYFEYPEHVSEHQELDTLEVSFWGVNWFRSEDGEPVRYGSSLESPIVRQLDPETAENINKIVWPTVFSIKSAILLSIVASGGNLLPTWIFLHALQTMSHVPLFQSQMPPSVSFFMASFLDICRFDPLITWIIDKPAFLDYYGLLGDGPLNLNFRAYGYKSVHLIDNMPAILIICLLILLLAIPFLVKSILIGLAKSYCTRTV